VPGFIRNGLCPLARLLAFFINTRWESLWPFPTLRAPTAEPSRGAGLLLGVLALLAPAAVSTKSISGLIFDHKYPRLPRRRPWCESNGGGGSRSEQPCWVTRLQTPRNGAEQHPECHGGSALRDRELLGLRETEDPAARWALGHHDHDRLRTCAWRQVRADVAAATASMGSARRLKALTVLHKHPLNVFSHQL